MKVTKLSGASISANAAMSEFSITLSGDMDLTEFLPGTATPQLGEPKTTPSEHGRIGDVCDLLNKH